MLHQMIQISLIVRPIIVELVFIVTMVNLGEATNWLREALIEAHCLDQPIHHFDLLSTIAIDLTKIVEGGVFQIGHLSITNASFAKLY